MTERIRCIADLRASRTKSPALLWSLLILAVISAYSWVWALASGEVSFADTLSERRLRNLDRFLGEIRPAPLQGRDFDVGVLLDWIWGLMAQPGVGGNRDAGWEATLQTLAISVVAICIAGLLASLLALPAARNVARADPFVGGPREPSVLVRRAWGAVVAVTRAAMVFARAVPEYIWAFLLLTMLGSTAWPAVVALALHNAGILGRLQSEVVEDVERAPPSALRELGASRAQIALYALIPLTMPRFLLFFFYRWETCVREATVLGLLGIASLGAAVNESRAAQLQDEMVFFVLVGAVLVLAGDLVSMIVRGLVRDAT
jgi:ABC-type phosphate/phosphonate transport system permease subunit